MRDLLYKNLTSSDKRKRIIASTEIADKAGVHSVIRRHFVCLVKPIKSEDLFKPKNTLYVVKRRDTRLKRERFFCKMKGSLLTVSKANLIQVDFIHTLKVNLCASEKMEQIG